MDRSLSSIIALAISMAATLAPALADDAAKTQPAESASQTKGAEATQAKDAAPTETKDAGAAQTKDAAAPQTKETQPQPTQASGPPELHRARMRLSGSMCMACLHTLEEKLRQVQGVEDAKIRRTQGNYFQPVPQELSTWADALFIYDEKRLSLNDLRYTIKQYGYHSYQVSDQHLDHAPQEKDLKL
jgi:hypothetical protein